MFNIIQIEWSAASLEEARKISRYLVQERLVASASIIPWTEKIYLLNGHVETMQESRILFVAQKEHFEKIQKIILGNSSYQIPEITYRGFDHVNQEYLQWIEVNGTALR